ncbi:MAG: hypothetical protein IPK69_05230 [Phycisphaerales bacterium]|nr:MAG: hypothetical protein IPK69_05230 [Phycisphaerales bacterium]
MTPGFSKDVAKAKAALKPLPREWEGKKSVLELKAADYNWKQMEWWAFYFEHLCHQKLTGEFAVPGERFGTVRFDLKRAVNWDMKAKAIKSDDHKCILNDCSAIDATVAKYGEHGIMIALCDVEYNDVDRSFQRWHSRLKGGLSDYEKRRRARTSVSRYRKTNATLSEILFLRFDEAIVKRLGRYNQGRNSNGRPRPPKYMLDLEDLEGVLVDRLRF